MIIHDANGQPYDADLVPGPQYRELAAALEKIHDYLPSPEFYDDIDGPTLSAVKRIQSVVTAALSRRHAKQ